MHIEKVQAFSGIDMAQVSCCPKKCNNYSCMSTKVVSGDNQKSCNLSSFKGSASAGFTL